MKIPVQFALEVGPGDIITGIMMDCLGYPVYMEEDGRPFTLSAPRLAGSTEPVKNYLPDDHPAHELIDALRVVRSFYLAAMKDDPNAPQPPGKPVNEPGPKREFKLIK